MVVPVSELSQLLREADSRGHLTTRERAKRIDGRLHWATIAKYQNGTHPDDPDLGTLRALAEAYGLAVAEVQRAAGVKPGAGQYVPPAEASRLTRREQEAISHLIKTMVREKDDAQKTSSAAGEATADAGPAASAQPGDNSSASAPGVNQPDTSDPSDPPGKPRRRQLRGPGQTRRNASRSEDSRGIDADAKDRGDV